MNRSFLRLFILLLATVSGCSTPPRYYVLDSLELHSNRANVIGTPTIGLEAIELPGYIDQTRITTRTGRNTLAVAPHDEWHEPLDAGVQRVLAANLATLIPEAQVEREPWPRRFNPDYRLNIDISRFDANQEGAVSLAGSWAVAAGNNHDRGDYRSYDIRLPSQGNAHSDIAATMSDALAQLSRQIAEALPHQP